ncbi:ALG6, ALG8 glycosyltransferase [Coprinellus micaceus]|uniref:Alpha-1,3-glucosyltransferase n=1 Tax=Coprinellus micaceus TaxID=71717 RepID=A0A4Y7U2J1_COPMI|nr:ALG6, ALG8 glycosyltransferase [Coprinellus micaceus]
MHKRGMRDWVVPSIVAFAVLLKVCIGVGSYSGEATPPMYGDYEAQRHWMELTQHLPFRQWYTYDLQYWGLDYPPLTAYHSWLCGFIGSLIDPSWFALDTSRGIETPSSKLFMRMTVLVSDLLIYIPALILFTRTFLPSPTRSSRSRSFALLTLLLQPALILVDNGHFQFNSIMLGFTILALCAFARDKDELGAVAFVAALGFKQMSLYYAPAIGSYLVAKCLWLPAPANVRLFTRLALVTGASFGILFLPFFLPPLASSPLDILNPISRIFPFSRGLFEDKVANWWCASNVVIKWRRIAGDGEAGRRWLVRASAGLTALGFLPAVVGLVKAGWGLRVREPSVKKADRDIHEPKPLEVSSTPTTDPPPFISLLTYALLSSSASFFLFSFQVHEKTILLPLLPLTLLMSAATPESAPWKWGCLVNNVAVFSMWPLLRRDGLAVPYVALTVLWDRVVGYNPFGVRAGVGVVEVLGLVVHLAAIGLHLLELVIPAPARYPDLFPVLNVLICTPVFGLAWLWSLKCGVEVGWALGGYSSSSSSSPSIRDSKSESQQQHSGFEPIEEVATGSGAQWGEDTARRRNVGGPDSGVGDGVW